jgi:chromosome segregation ATPase
MDIGQIFSPENVAGAIAFGSAAWAYYNKYKAKLSEKRAKTSEDKAVQTAVDTAETLETLKAERQMLRNVIENERSNNVEIRLILDESQQERAELRQEIQLLKAELEKVKTKLEKAERQLEECRKSNAAISNQLSNERSKPKGKGYSRNQVDEGAWKADAGLENDE